MGQTARKIGPYSRPSSLAKLDGRSREASLMRRTAAELTAHVGGSPSATQRGLIDRAAWLTLHVAQLDDRALQSGGFMGEHDARQYIAWSNALTRTLRQLGTKGEAPKPMSFRERLIAEKAAAP